LWCGRLARPEKCRRDACTTTDNRPGCSCARPWPRRAYLDGVGASKLAGECYARAYHRTYGLPTVVVRPFNNFGPRAHHEGDSGEVIPRFAVWALCGNPPVVFGDGRQTRDFIYVEETARWLCRVAEADALVGQTINLASGQETSVLELAQMVYEEAGAAGLEPDFRPPRPGDVRRHLAAVDRARELLGFRVEIGVREGIRRVIEHFRNVPGGPASLLNDAQPVNWVSLKEKAS